MPAISMISPTAADTLADPVFAAIEIHRVAWSEFSAVAKATKAARFMSKGEAQRKAARDLYDARTEAMVRDTHIASLAGLHAFVRYLAALQAYGCSSCAVEVWHLSDAMDAIAEALARLAPGRPAPTLTEH